MSKKELFTQKYQNIVESVALHCAINADKLAQVIWSLLPINHPSVYLFGFYLAQYADGQSVLLACVNYPDRKLMTPSNADPLFLRGFFLGIAQRLKTDPNPASELIELITRNVSSIETKLFNFDTVQTLINDLDAPAETLAFDLKDFLLIANFLLNQPRYGSWLVLDILAFYQNRSGTLPQELNTLIYKLISGFLITEVGDINNGQGTRRSIGDVGKNLLGLLWDLDPRSQESLQAVKLIADHLLSFEEYKGFDYPPKQDIIRDLLPLVFEKYADDFWSMISQTLTEIFFINSAVMNSLTGINSNDINAKVSPILSVSEALLFEWCYQFPNQAPKILIRMPPILENFDGSGSWHPIVQWLLDHFGEQPELLSELDQNIGRYSGELSTYYNLYTTPLESLRNHKFSTVRQWAIAKQKEFRKKLSEDKNRHSEFDFFT